MPIFSGDIRFHNGVHESKEGALVLAVCDKTNSCIILINGFDTFSKSSIVTYNQSQLLRATYSWGRGRLKFDKGIELLDIVDLVDEIVLTESYSTV